MVLATHESVFAILGEAMAHKRKVVVRTSFGITYSGTISQNEVDYIILKTEDFGEVVIIREAITAIEGAFQKNFSDLSVDEMRERIQK